MIIKNPPPFMIDYKHRPFSVICATQSNIQKIVPSSEMI